MTQDELIKLLSGIKDRVSSNVMKTIQRILVIATEYSYLGKQFTFDVNADLNDEVNRILVELSDAILDDVDTATYKVIEDDEDTEAVFAYIYGDENGIGVEERVDYHSSNLKSLLEWYFAFCFADKLTNADILGNVQPFLNKPNTYGKDDGFHFGKGVAINPIEGMTILSQHMVNRAKHYEDLLGYRKDPNIIGYRVHRGSGYDCDICQDATIGIHPLDDMIVPLHPRCACFTTPVYVNNISK